jgi:DNA-binding transcriptional ArsR family regulator
MVEYALNLDTVFGSLADPTRRDILQRVTARQLTVSEIAQPYDMSLAAISKHIKIMEKAKLIIKRRKGKEQIVSLAPQTLKGAADYLESYRLEWDDRFNRLEKILEED